MTGGNDGKIIFWNQQFVMGKTIDISGMVKYQPGIRSLDYLDQSNMLLVGTKGSDIIEVNAVSGLKLNHLMNGHFEGNKQAELWGCAVHPNKQEFATCGGDNTLRVWTATEMLAVSEQFTNDITACDWACSGAFIVVGDRCGFIHTVDA